MPHTQTNQSLTELDLVLSRALRQTSDVDFSPQCIFQFVVGCSTYPHIYLSTYPHIQVGGAVCSPMLEIPPVFALCYLNSIPSQCRMEACQWVCSQNILRIPDQVVPI